MDLSHLAQSRDWARISELIRQFCGDNFRVCPSHLVLELPYLGSVRLPLALPLAGSARPSPSSPRVIREPYHTADYQLVRWQGQEFVFGPKQRLIVKALWEAWERGHPGVDQQTLLRAADSDCVKISELFRNHPAWGTLIVRAAASVYRLALPLGGEIGEDPGEDSDSE